MGKHESIFRIRILIIFILLFAVTLLGKLYYVQIVQVDEYREDANKQYARPSGNIFNWYAYFISFIFIKIKQIGKFLLKKLKNMGMII